MHESLFSLVPTFFHEGVAIYYGSDLVGSVRLYPTGSMWAIYRGRALQVVQNTKEGVAAVETAHRNFLTHALRLSLREPTVTKDGHVV